MKKTNYLFMIWGVIVVIIVVLLTIMGFMLKNNNKGYKRLENKLMDDAKKYVDAKFLYPEEEGVVVKVTSEELIENKFLDELKNNDDVCRGYVTVVKNGVYQYHSYIKCKNYTTTNYGK